MDAVQLQPLPFQSAIDYFRSKGYKMSFDYRDIEPEAHATAFTVAKAMRTDILQDIRTAVDQAITSGTTFKTFQDNLRPTLEEKGWWGIKEMTDPETGETKDVQLGSVRRLRTIYDTNMRTSFAAGKWEQVERTKKILPYLRYVGMNDDREREEHRAWNDTVLPVDHPFWLQHYPPNGWGCRCTVQQVGDAQVSALGLSVSSDGPVEKMVSYINNRTGRMMTAPAGVDPSFAYNPGKERMKALTPPPIDQPLKVSYSGDPADVPMPAPRTLPEDILLQGDMSNEEGARTFLKEFGADIGDPKVFTDVTGEPVVISEDLFKTANGAWKMAKRSRLAYLLLLAKTIQEPDEIWQTWEEYPQGRFSLLRRYISSFTVAGMELPAFSLFDTKQDGWVGVTSFKPDDASYINKQRKGTLVYRRPDKTDEK